MKKKETLLNFFKFLKQNFKIILLTTLVFSSTIVILASNFINERRSQESNNQVTIDEEYIVNDVLPNIKELEDINELSKSEVNTLNDYLNKDSYSFRFIVENPDFTLFNDRVILKEFLINNKLIKNLSKEENIEWAVIPELAVRVNSVEDSELLELTIRTGNKEYNKKIASYYYELLSEENIPFLDTKTTYLVSSVPEIKNTSSESSEPTITENIDVPIDRVNSMKEILITTVIGVVGGLILGIIISIIKDIYNKKIPSIYNFKLTENQKIINLDLISFTDKLNVSELMSLLKINNKSTKKLLLSEHPITIESKEQFQNCMKTNSAIDINYVKNIENYNLSEVNEVIVLIEIYKTSKEWYEQQIKALKNLDKEVKIIRLPLKRDFLNFKDYK